MNTFVILALVALQVAAISALPPCVCKRNLKPVCGSDGVTYSNECVLTCESSKGDVQNLTVAKQGPCKPEAALPICICTYEYKPVCASDGTTYPNRCSFDCERSDANPITVVHEGQCAEKVKVAEPVIPTCTCTREAKPVCGSNGATYANDCLLNCATANDSSLSIKHTGPCEIDPINVPLLPPCTCTRNLNPVCGSDGVTYANDCLLNCATGDDHSLKMKHVGPCDESTANNVPTPPCICTANLEPVCGSDGVTYANDCLLNCATATNPSLSIAHKGVIVALVALQAAVISAHPYRCVCKHELNAVCGSDGITYSNECMLNCESSKRDVPKLTVAKQGSCRPENFLPTCICTEEYKPVCAIDGKTYPNRCSLDCVRSYANPSIIELHEGQCADKVKVAEPVIPTCTCTREAKPVCGSNGVTYANDCLLNCATANDSSLSIKHTGPCEIDPINVPLLPPCTCTRNLNPVCGSDGVTYANDCLLNCATGDNHSLKMKHVGPCDESTANNVPAPPCICTENLEPVCGSDGVTYANDCLLNCATASNSSLSIAHKGGC